MSQPDEPVKEKTIYLLHKWEIDESGPYPVARDTEYPLWALSHITRLAHPIFHVPGLVNLLPKWQGLN